MGLRKLRPVPHQTHRLHIMIQLRRSKERGYADHGWLKSHHSFSFAGYYDPAHMGWGNLRVINEDRVAPGTGFGTHGHRDMEIVSYVLEGELAHRDSTGKSEVIFPGQIQRMSAGTGVRHSEYNHSSQGETHFLQIWIEPNQHGIVPSYEQRACPGAGQSGRLHLIASPEGGDGAVTLHADARIYAGRFEGQQSETVGLNPDRKAYLHVARGQISVNDWVLEAGDAVLIADESALTLSGGHRADVLLFDLAP